MLTGDLALVRLLLCLVIARNVSLCTVSSASTTEEPEVAKVPEASQVVPEASQVVRTSVTPMKPRIVQRTTVLKRANRLGHEDNSTSTLKLLNYEDDNSTTTTRLPGPLSYESATRKTANFRPSIHLGEINGYETRKSSTNPFNNVQHAKFENSVKIGESDTDGARASVSKTSSFVHGPERATAAVDGGKRNNRVKFFETDSRYGIDVPVEHPQQEYFEQQNEHAENNDDDDHHHHDNYHNHQHNDHHYNDQHYDNNGYNEPEKVPLDHETLVTFVRPQEHYGEVTARPMTLGRPVYPSIISEQVHVQEYKPVTDNVKTIYVKPSKFHGEVEIVTLVPVPVPVPVLVPGPVPGPVHIHHYEYGTPASAEAIVKPEVHLHHQGGYEVSPQEGHAAKVPGPVHIQHYGYGTPASAEAIVKPEVHLHHQGGYEVLPQDGHAAKVPGPVHIQHYGYGAPASGEAIEKPEVHLHHQGGYEVLPQDGHAAKVPGPVHIQHYGYGAPASGEAIEKPEVHLHHQGGYEVLPQEGHAAKVPGPVHIQHYGYGAPASGEAIEKPEVHLHHLGGYELLPQEAHADDTGKPETVLYLTSHRETAYTKTRKFPYTFHHPGLGYQDNEYHFVQEGPHAHPSKGRRISPWKKILHLIGTFIPLGLLLATLTPNVVKIGNTTQSTVVSKLRAVDLPVEHKQARLIDEPNGQQQNTCEDRSICELIVSRSDPISNLLQNILWSLTTKSSDEEAKKHDLHDIFEAVKRKDCTNIDCRRYKDQ